LDDHEYQTLEMKVTGREKVEEMTRALVAQKLGMDAIDVANSTYIVKARQIETEDDRLVMAAMAVTQSQRNMREMLDETSASVVHAGLAGTTAMGTPGAGGRGILGFSYAFQDFTSVMTQGGANALPRAMGAIANNIDQMAMSAGLSAAAAGKLSLAFTGLTVGMPLLIPIFQTLWGAIGGGESAKEALENLKKIQEEIEKTHQAFVKMTQAPTDYEKQAAETMKLVLEDRPNANKAKEAVALAMSDEEAESALTSEEKEDLRAGETRKKGLDAQSKGAYATFFPGSYQADRENLAKVVDENRRRAIINARRRRAEQVIEGAKAPGPAGQADRDELLRLTKDVPGLERLQGATPEQMKADEADYTAVEAQNQQIAESGKAIGDARKKDARDQKKKDAEAKRKWQHEKQELDRRTLDDIKNAKEVEDKARRRRARDRVLAFGERNRVPAVFTPSDVDEMAGRVVHAEDAGDDTETAVRQAVQPRAAAARKQVGKDQAIRDVTALSQQMGAGTPTADQAGAMADAALKGINDGMGAQMAVFQAVTSKIMQINQAVARQNQMYQSQAAWMNQLNMGGDASGQMSAMPTMSGMGTGG
jgi:hypothetical protein